MSEKRKPMKPQHAAFADNWVANGGNGQKAAEDAGFASGASGAVLASRLLRREDVQERINERLASASVLPQEIVGTLAEQMRGDITDALPQDDPLVMRVKAAGVSHLIRKLKITTSRLTGETTYDVEFYDAQAAARTLGKYKGLEQAARENDADVRRKTDAVSNLIERTYQASVDAGDPKDREEIARSLASKRPDLAAYISQEWIN